MLSARPSIAVDWFRIVSAIEIGRLIDQKHEPRQTCFHRTVLQANLCRPSSTAKVDSHSISVRYLVEAWSDDAWKRVCSSDRQPCDRPLSSHPSAKRSRHDVVGMLDDSVLNGHASLPHRQHVSSICMFSVLLWFVPANRCPRE